MVVFNNLVGGSFVFPILLLPKSLKRFSLKCQLSMLVNVTFFYRDIPKFPFYWTWNVVW